MALNPEHLLTFVRVARLGNLSAAAAELNLTQPAVSSQIKLLTHAVGEPLVSRHRYGVKLTPAGEGLLPYAVSVGRAVDGARQYVRDLRGLTRGVLSVAASSTIAASLLPGVLALYHTRHPEVSLQVRQGNTLDALDAVGRSEVEVALIEGAPDELEPGLKGQVFQRDELLLVAAPSHPLAQARGPLKLDGLPLVWRERGSGTREVAERALQAAGIQTPVLLELPGTEAVKEALISGLGAAFLSELRVRRELDAGLLVRLDARLPGLRRELRCVAPPENQLSRAARAFVALLTEGQQPWNDSRAG